MKDCFLDVTYNSDFDEELNIIHSSAKLKLISIDTEDELIIGHAEFLLFNEYLFDDWFDLVDIADGLSDDTYEVFNVLTPFREDEEIEGKIVILNSFEIVDEYRNHGWGSTAMEEFLKYWSYFEIDYLALKPAPIENSIKGKERAKYIERLTKFYNKFGLKPLCSPEYEERKSLMGYPKEIEWQGVDVY